MKYKFELDRNLNELEVVVRSQEFNDEVKELIEYLEQTEKKSTKWLTSRTEDGVQLIEVETIHYLEVEGDMVNIYSDKDIYHIKDRLYRILDKINHPDFIQVSKSAAIHLKFLEILENSFSGTMLAILKDGSKVPVSRKYLKNLMTHLKV